MGRRWMVVVQCVVSVALLSWLFKSLDTRAFAALFLKIPAWFYATSLGVVLGGQVLYAWRWGRLLHASGVHVSTGHMFRHYFVGVFANNFMPGTIGGDVVKIYYVGREHGYQGVTASVVVDRVLGVGVLAAIGAGAAWIRPVPGPRYAAARLALTLVAALAAGVLALAFSGTGGLVNWLEPLGPRAVALGVRMQRFRHALAFTLAKPVVFAQATLVVAAYFVALTTVYLWFFDLALIPRPHWWALFIAVTATAVLSNVPIALNGLGVREQLHAWLLAPLGVPAATAIAISLLLYGHQLVASLFGLVGWLKAPALPADVADHVGV